MYYNTKTSQKRTTGPGIVQLHAADYRNPSQLRKGGTLVVGVGNSGAEIAVELAGSHRTWLAGKEMGNVPVSIDGLVARYVFHPLLSVGTTHVRDLPSRSSICQGFGSGLPGWFPQPRP